MKTPDQTDIASSSNGFSLIEVTIALGVLSICLVTLLALIPAGLNSNRTSLSRTQATSIASAVAADLQLTDKGDLVTPKFKITVPAAGAGSTMVTGAPQVLYFADRGNATGEAGDGVTMDSRYRVTVGFAPPAAGRKSSTMYRILVSEVSPADAANQWPDASRGSVEILAALNLN